MKKYGKQLSNQKSGQKLAKKIKWSGTTGPFLNKERKKGNPKREITKTFDDILDCYTNNHDIKDALVEFIKMRQRF